MEIREISVSTTMPAKNFITPSQKENLQKALRESDCPHFRERILMLLLMNDGKTYQEITDFLGCAYRSVAYWCAHGDPEHLDSLRDQREKGNFRKVTEAYIQLLMEVIEKEPSSCTNLVGGVESDWRPT